jgi:hypothetical protein
VTGFQGCFLANLSSFGQADSEEKIFLEINQSEIRIVCGGHVVKPIGKFLFLIG